MGVIREISFLLQKEFLLEWRSSYALSGILLYVFSTIFIIYTAFINVEPPVWNVLFWVIMLFTSINAIVKSFIQESSKRTLYYYTLVNPIAVILSKMIYNALLLLVISFLVWGGFSLITENPVQDIGLFCMALGLAALGFSITFTFISAISAKAGNNATLMAILAFPLIIPVLMTLIKLSASALGLIVDTSVRNDIYILCAIDLILLGLTLVLFPFLWKD